MMTTHLPNFPGARTITAGRRMYVGDHQWVTIQEDGLTWAVMAGTVLVHEGPMPTFASDREMYDDAYRLCRLFNGCGVFEEGNCLGCGMPSEDHAPLELAEGTCDCGGTIFPSTDAQPALSPSESLCHRCGLVFEGVASSVEEATTKPARQALDEPASVSYFVSAIKSLVRF